MLKLLPLLFLIAFSITSSLRTEATPSSLLPVATRQSGQSMYVNASKLNLREAPSTSSRALLILKAPTLVEVIGKEGEWSRVRVAEVTGYVITSYLVGTLDEITVKDLDLAYARRHPRLTYTEPLTVKKTPSTAQAKGATVYYCASGNTVKYHRSSGCRGLSRCGASIDPISLRDAQRRMDPCKICY